MHLLPVFMWLVFFLLLGVDIDPLILHHFLSTLLELLRLFFDRVEVYVEELLAGHLSIKDYPPAEPNLILELPLLPHFGHLGRWHVLVNLGCRPKLGQHWGRLRVRIRRVQILRQTLRWAVIPISDLNRWSYNREFLLLLWAYVHRCWVFLNCGTTALATHVVLSFCLSLQARSLFPNCYFVLHEQTTDFHVESIALPLFWNLYQLANKLLHHCLNGGRISQTHFGDWSSVDNAVRALEDVKNVGLALLVTANIVVFIKCKFSISNELTF